MENAHEDERIQPITDVKIKKIKEEMNSFLTNLTKSSDAILVLSRTNKKTDVAQAGTRTQIALSIIEYLEQNPEIKQAFDCLQQAHSIKG